MAITVKHSKVSTIPDTDNTDLVRPSDWNADHVLTGTIPVANGGTGADNPTDARTNLSAAKSGANSDITSMTGVTGGISTPDFVQYDTTATPTIALGKERWNVNTGTLAFGIIDGTQEVQIGQQMYAQAVNAEAITITKGQPVYLYQATGNRASVKLAYNTSDATSAKTLGLAAQDITAGATGFIITQGVLDKLNTGSYLEGDTLYLGATAGTLTATKPAAPNHLVYIGVVERANNGNGQIYVRVQNGYELDEIHDVSIVNPTTGQTIVYDQSTQLWNNSNAPTIIGGSINNTPIGATTPSTGSFTTITGQTEVLRGTGQNLFIYSSDFVSGWTKGTLATWTTNAAVAPDGSTTALGSVGLTGTVISATQGALYRQNISIAGGVPYTFSVYVKSQSGTLTNIVLRISEIGGNNTVSSAFTVTDTAWTRISLTVTTASAATLATFVIGTNTGTSNVYIWGAQLEIGSVVNTYIPTTTTAVYGTPTLSFSGVSTIGLQSDGSLYVSPAGTGAIQAQATTSTTAGGNARGANAVDWQTSRNAASQVASSPTSVLSGGYNNIVSGTYASVVGGLSNSSAGTATFVGGGNNNTAGGQSYAVVCGGWTNTANGFYNFIGSGFTNSGTSSSAVTTQSGTMNGTTAVTLSGSNASIKVGQYISGTSIATGTYVAAISGTSLTLSQAASGSSTSTLSFFTPHGVVVGGGNNQATGAYSFIGGGGDAGTSANRNVASGDWSFVGGGRNNTASGIGATVAGGGLDGSSSALGNTASGLVSVVGGGLSNTASGTGSSVLGGYQNLANGIGSTILGGRYGNTRSIAGSVVASACYLPLGEGSGVVQSATLVLARQTTDATATVLASNTAAAGTTNQVILPNNSAYYFKGSVIAGKTGAGDTSAWTFEGAIKRGANAASTTLVAAVTPTLVSQDAGASGWVLAVAADTTNGGIKVTVTGQASTTIRWVCKIDTTEMTF